MLSNGHFRDTPSIFDIQSHFFTLYNRFPRSIYRQLTPSRKSREIGCTQKTFHYVNTQFYSQGLAISSLPHAPRRRLGTNCWKYILDRQPTIQSSK